MQKPNPVIKNYIYSEEKRILQENPHSVSKELIKPIFIEILLYHSHAGQNKEFSCLFPS